MNVKKSITLNNVTAKGTNWLKIKYYFKNPELNDIAGHTVTVWPQTPGNGGRLFGELFFFLHFNRETLCIEEELEAVETQSLIGAKIQYIQ